MELINLLRNVEFKSNINLEEMEDIKLEDIAYNSAKAKEGVAFVALEGMTLDGHKFANDAYDRGSRVFILSKDLELPKDSIKILVKNTRKALAKLSCNFFGNPSKELKVIGITGTKGKTTTSNYIRDIFKEAGYSTGIIGTNGVFYNGIEEETKNTTPESYEIQRILRKMLDSGVKAALLEVSSGGLKMDRVEGIDFDIGVFTNISRDHIGPKEHPNFEDYLYSKSRLFKLCRHGIVNIDDMHGEYIIENSDCPIETFSIKNDSDFKAIDINLSKNIKSLGSSFLCKTRKDEYRYKIATPGIFSIYNALASIAVSNYLGISREIVNDVLEKANVSGRAELLDVVDYASVVLDYAHNEVSLENIIRTLKEYKKNRLICLFGSVGDRSILRRQEMGDIAAKECDISIVTSDNPGFESPEKIIDEIGECFKGSKSKLIKEVDREKAIKLGIELLEKDDIFLIAGKGHEEYQLVEGEKIHFSDREVALEAGKELLKEKNGI